MRTYLVLALLLLLLTAAPALGQTATLDGPDGTSLNKVLVIGTDGTRWDLLRSAMRSGQAPNLARLARQGFARPSTLDYSTGTLTLSEVGWSSLASGVWEDKHGVDGSEFNMDPLQATKNGYLDFITRIENRRGRLSTFVAADWINIGLVENGGPIFGTARDTLYSPAVRVETIEAWDEGDELVTAESEHYLRRGDPDAGFVYLGLVDETAHLSGSATPVYPAAITTTDRRIGRLLRAVRARPSYALESWTILVSTDHGQRPLDFPSLATHLGDTPLERTVFVVGSGPGLAGKVPKSRIVDIAPTVLHQLGLRTPSSWNLDGRSLSRAKPPSSALVAVRGRGASKRLAVRLRLGSGARRARAVVVRLPKGVRILGDAGQIRARVNGGPAAFVRLAGRRTITVRPGRRLRTLKLDTAPGTLRDAGRRSAEASLSLRGPKGSRGTLRVPLVR